MWQAAWRLVRPWTKEEQIKNKPEIWPQGQGTSLPSSPYTTVRGGGDMSVGWEWHPWGGGWQVRGGWHMRRGVTKSEGGDTSVGGGVTFPWGGGETSWLVTWPAMEGGGETEGLVKPEPRSARILLHKVMNLSRTKHGGEFHEWKGKYQTNCRCHSFKTVHKTLPFQHHW